MQQDQGVVKSDQAQCGGGGRSIWLYCTITSPVAGRVGLRQVDIGNLVEAGQTNGIVVVTQLQPISVLFTVPEDNIDDIMAALQPRRDADRRRLRPRPDQRLATGRWPPSTTRSIPRPAR